MKFSDHIIIFFQVRAFGAQINDMKCLRKNLPEVLSKNFSANNKL